MPTNTPVAIVTSPANVAVPVGDAAAFSVVASGFPIFYQWRRDGVPLAGATNAGFTINSVSVGEHGRCFPSWSATH